MKILQQETVSVNVPSREKVLILGATGFVGSYVMAALMEDQYFTPVPGSRRSAVPVDATDPKSMTAALQDVKYVVNCMSGRDHSMVQSTTVLCNAARSSPPRRIVHLSSMAVYGAASGLVSEFQPPVQPTSSYGEAKIECERIVRKYVEDGGDAVILRPTCIFGRGSRQWTTRLERLLLARRIGDLGVAGDGNCNLAFIDDVVACVVAALNASDVCGRSFNISSSDNMSWNEFLVRFATALGATPVRRISSRKLLIETKLLAPVLRIAQTVMKVPTAEVITPSLTALWRQDIRVDCSAAETVLALQRTPMEKMIATVTKGRRPLREAA